MGLADLELIYVRLILEYFLYHQWTIVLIIIPHSYAL